MSKLAISDAFFDRIMKVGSPDKVVVRTTISQQLKWLSPFEEYDNTWRVYPGTFVLSKGLKAELEAIKNEANPVSLGEFIMRARKVQGQFGVDEIVKDTYSVMINHGDDVSLTTTLPEKSKINNGLYGAFEGAILQGGFPVNSIVVELEGNAYFNQVGVGVEQKQTVYCESCCPGPSQVTVQKEYTHFEIEVLGVHALFDSLIAVNFSKTTSFKHNDPEVYISLRGYVPTSKDTKEDDDDDDYDMAKFDETRRHEIKLYPQSFSHGDVLQVFYKDENTQANSVNRHAMYAKKREETMPLKESIKSCCRPQ